MPSNAKAWVPTFGALSDRYPRQIQWPDGELSSARQLDGKAHHIVLQKPWENPDAVEICEPCHLSYSEWLQPARAKQRAATAP